MLKDIDSGEVTKIIPNTEFNIPSGNFINLNEARLCVNGKTSLILRAGETISGNRPRGKKRPYNKKPVDAPIETIIPKEKPSLLKVSDDEL